jgi:hypothetical protein
MKPDASSRKPGSAASGFALVITLLLMILLTILAVGLLTLSGVALRTSRQDEALAVARSNARLGLLLAIGEIQKQLGPDQKITAVSELFNPGEPAVANTLKHSHLTGIWEPRQEALGTTPDYDRAKSFVTWLVSSSQPDALRQPDFARTGVFDQPIVMAGRHGSHPSNQPTYAGLVPVANSGSTLPGDVAWWVADENCKGFTNPSNSLARAKAAPTVPDLLAAAATPGASGMRVNDKNYPVNTPAVAKVLSHGQLALAASSGTPTGTWFHDLSPYSQGLLTNVVKGGMRQDLNLYLEQTDPPPFDYPNKSVTSAIGPNGKYALSTLAEYDVLPWKSLYNFYHLKELVQLDGGRPMLRTWDGATGVTPNDLINPKWNAGVLRPTPVMVRAVIFVAFGAIKNPTNQAQYLLRFYAYPVITLWNPYNVDLQVQARHLNYLFTSLPMRHKLYVNNTYKEDFMWCGYFGNGLQPILNKTLTLQPGEARMLSPNGTPSWQTNPDNGNHQYHLMEDVPFNYSQSSPGGIWGQGTMSSENVISYTMGTATDTVKVATRVCMYDRGELAFVAGYPATFDIRGNHASGDDGQYWIYGWGQKVGWLYESTVADVATPDRLTRTNEPKATFSEIFNAPRPFMVVDMQLKALDEADIPNKTWRDCIPSHPYQGVTQGLNNATPYFANPYKLRFDTINSYQEASSYLQVAPDNPVHTYFGGSYFPAAGVPAITDREVPLAPLTSLAQLQHVAQQSIDNLYSSGFLFQNRAIGNSFASPGVPSNQLKAPSWPFCVDVYLNGTSLDGKTPVNEFWSNCSNTDRSYAANHLLWDDYFFSSMAARNDVLRGTTTKGVDQVVERFYTEGAPLPNERYQPWLGGQPATAVTGRLLNGTRLDSNAFRKVAAYLLVDGAFNVNSTSVTAWKTMLAAAHQKNVVTLGADGQPTASGAKNYVVSRFSMPNAGSDLTGPAAAKGAWQGYHELTEAQLGELAAACVRQVKARGPFRSLAEFINRRLGPESDERTQYGALQAALEDPGVSINAQYRSPLITADQLALTTYQNKSAALGSTYQGSPPCVAQADLLNTLGPVLSVRSDTFLVRAYGRCRDATGKVLATAWCEAVVQRHPGYMDPTDAAETAPADLSVPVNKTFGRRFNLISFRWLSANEL